MAKPKQLDLEDYIAKRSQGELHDAFTGEVFTARARNHYEVNDGVPFAPPVDFPRPTIRQRVENLLNRGVDPLARYVGHEGSDMDVPDDPQEELTPSEMNYLDAVAESLAEQAPLPDEGLPRPQPEPSSAPVQSAPPPPQLEPGGVSSPPQAFPAPSAPPGANSTVPSR